MKKNQKQNQRTVYESHGQLVITPNYKKYCRAEVESKYKQTARILPINPLLPQ